MPPIFHLALLLSLSAPIAPVPKAPSKIVSPTATTGGAAAEAADDTRASPPAKVDAAVRDVLLRLGENPEVTPTEQAQLDAIVASLRVHDRKKARAQWKTLVAAHRTRKGSIDVDTLVQWVLREAYLDANADLKDVAAKVAAINAAKKQVREHLQELRDALTESSGKGAFAFATIVVCKKCEPGETLVKPGGTKVLTAAQWTTYADALRAWMETAGEDAQLATVDLQQVLAKEQQTHQMLSNITKMMHDTAKAIIDNTRG